MLQTFSWVICPSLTNYLLMGDISSKPQSNPILHRVSQLKHYFTLYQMDLLDLINYAQEQRATTVNLS